MTLSLPCSCCPAIVVIRVATEVEACALMGKNIVCPGCVPDLRVPVRCADPLRYDFERLAAADPPEKHDRSLLGEITPAGAARVLPVRV